MEPPYRAPHEGAFLITSQDDQLDGTSLDSLRLVAPSNKSCVGKSRSMTYQPASIQHITIS